MKVAWLDDGYVSIELVMTPMLAQIVFEAENYHGDVAR